MIQKKVNFKNQNGYNLSGILQLPDTKPLAYALFTHCFTCSKNLKAIHNISASLLDQQIGVLRFDFTGLGESEGDFADTNFTSNIEDIFAACEFLREKYELPSILVGHSLGGAAVLQAAKEIDSCKAVVTIGAPSDPSHVVHHIGSKKEEIEKEGVAEVNIVGRKFKLKKQFLDDLKKQRLLDKVKNLNRALLILHAPYDNIVGIDNASEIFLAAKHPKSFISLDNADHLLSDPKDSYYVGFVIAAWARKYLGNFDEMNSSKPLDISKNQVTVETYESGYYSYINANGHDLIVDEPLSYGGTNKGPTPYDLLLASLGSCTNITLRMYADRKGIPLKKVITRLNHQRIHAEDCEECETREGKVDFIEKEIELFGDLTEDQRKRMLEIDDRCPVTRTLSSEISIKSSLK